MTQLQLFTKDELALMRDPAAARNYSSERDEFRREQQRRRAWGKARLHGERLHRIAESLRDPPQPDNRPRKQPTTAAR
jgi:hypothetical protein